MVKNETSTFVEKIQPIVHDTERIAALHGELLQSELRQVASEVTPALGALGAGAGLAATGGFLVSLAMVHGLHRATRLPLWGCYGAVGAMFATMGLGLMSSGRRRLSSVDFVPRQTLATIQEDIAWVKEKTT